jgi:hypothetical protein
MRGLIDTLFEGNNLTNEELKTLIECEDNSIQEEYLFKQADKKTQTNIRKRNLHTWIDRNK